MSSTKDNDLIGFNKDNDIESTNKTHVDKVYNELIPNDIQKLFENQYKDAIGINNVVIDRVHIEKFNHSTPLDNSRYCDLMKKLYEDIKSSKAILIENERVYSQNEDTWLTILEWWDIKKVTKPKIK